MPFGSINGPGLKHSQEVKGAAQGRHTPSSRHFDHHGHDYFYCYGTDYVLIALFPTVCQLVAQREHLQSSGEWPTEASTRPSSA